MSGKRKAEPVGDLLAGFAAGGVAAQAAVDKLTRAGADDESKCAVDVHCVELAHDAPEWFEVIYGASGTVIRFCPRHALAAEALISYAGWRGIDVPRVLRSLEGGGPPAFSAERQATFKGAHVVDDNCKACGGPRSEHNRSDACRGFE